MGKPGLELARNPWWHRYKNVFYKRVYCWYQSTTFPYPASVEADRLNSTSRAADGTPSFPPIVATANATPSPARWTISPRPFCLPPS